MKFCKRLFYQCMIYITIQPVWLAHKVEVLSVTGYVGQTVTLPCSFNEETKNLSIVQSQWYFLSPDGNNTSIIVYNKQHGKYVHESHLKGRVDMEDQSLQITNVELSDAGSYIYTATTFPDGSHGETTKLYVQELKLMSWMIYVIASGFLVLLMILSATLCFFCRRRNGTSRGDEHKQVNARKSETFAKKEEVVYSDVKMKKSRNVSSSNSKQEDSARSDNIIYSQVNVFQRQNE